jgi:hypothetical protein
MWFYTPGATRDLGESPPSCRVAPAKTTGTLLPSPLLAGTPRKAPVQNANAVCHGNAALLAEPLEVIQKTSVCDRGTPASTEQATKS